MVRAILFISFIMLRMRTLRHSTLRRLSFPLVCLALLLGGCRASKPTKPDVTRIEKTIHPGKINKTQRIIIDEAMSWLGTPYKYASAEKGVATDCSGMVVKVYEKAGRKLPRNSAKQAEFCVDLSPDEVEPGDLVFFATGKNPDRVSHVGIMLDPENFIHASASKGVVVSKVTSSYYIRTFKKYGRLPKDEKKR